MTRIPIHPSEHLAEEPAFWLNLQALYDLRLAERKVGKSISGLPTLKHAVHA